MKYITETAPIPLMRINYYIYAERVAGLKIYDGRTFITLEGIGWNLHNWPNALKCFLTLLFIYYLFYHMFCSLF